MNNLFAAVLVFAVASGAAAAQPGPAIVPAIDGIMAAFKDHPLVGLGDAHGLAQEQDFYAALVRDPRFAREVGNVVVEFGNAAQQGVIDRFVNGEDVPYAELRKVWTDPVGWAPPPADLGYVNLFAQIRAVNRGLPASGRIRVWLGDPPLDWSKIRSKADITPFPNGGSYRDVFSAALIEREILAKGKKAVAIFGWFHFNTDPVLQPVLGSDPMMVARVEQSHPNAFYIVTPYAGRKDKACAAEFEADKKDLAGAVPGRAGARHRAG